MQLPMTEVATPTRSGGTAQINGWGFRPRDFDPTKVRVPQEPAVTDTTSSDAPAEPVLDCTDPAAVTAHLAGLARDVVHSARLAANPCISDPAYRVVPPDANDWFRYMHQTGALSASHDETDRGGSFEDAGARSDEFFRTRLLALVQAHAQFWGSGHGRKLRDEYAAQLADAAALLTTEAVTASLAGLDTNPHDAADRLHRAIDNAQGWHLAEVGGHGEPDAYADSRLSTAILAMSDAMGATSYPAQMARALRSAVDLVIAEANDPEPETPAQDVPTQPPENQNAQPADDSATGTAVQA